jgi:threonine/homoserine/homoserine lactone efflux protein
VEQTSFLTGLIIGFAMAVPVGPIGMLCIRKTLTEGQLRGLIIGCGAATAEMLYGCVATFSLTFISNMMASQRVWLCLVGAGILFYLGVRTFRAQTVDPAAPVTGGGSLRLFFSAVLLALTNPLTIFAFVAVFAALGLGSGLSVFSEWALVLGIFLGSALWFMLLSVSASIFRKKLDTGGLRWVSRIAGVLIIMSGVMALASLF